MMRRNWRSHFLKIFSLFLLLFLALVISFLLEKPSLKVPTDIPAAISLSELSTLDCGPVTEVIDGDTIKVRLKESVQTVRYLSIDTPEIEHSFTGKDQPFGQEAKTLNESIVRDKVVCLQYDLQQKDTYNRLLAYVFLDNGIMVNEILLRAGYARLLIIKPNIKYTQRLTIAQQKAVEEKREIWSR